jgi:hypothetical protein
MWSNGRVINYGDDTKVSWQLQFTDYCYNWWLFCFLARYQVLYPVYHDFYAALAVDTNMIPAYLSGLAENVKARNDSHI